MDSPNPEKSRKYFFTAFLILLCIELFIGLFIRDRFIRPYVGDMLVVILIYMFIRILVPGGFQFLVWYVFLFALCVEMLQYFHLVHMLGLDKNRLAMIILGSTFDIKDILCYFTGCLLIRLWEKEKSGRTGP